MLTLENISKSFHGLPALREVSLTLRGGEVHGLLGENGAGKSTLMNVLFGLLRPDSGRIFLNGRPVTMHSPATARRLGIGMVHQHFKLVPTLNVLENFALGAGSGVGVMPTAKLRRQLSDLAETLGWKMPPERLVARLSVGEQQRLEIIKALAGSRAGDSQGVLILDEPTAVLTPQEFVELAAAMRRLAGRGLALVFITHKLTEVAQVCDHVTVLRRGRLVYEGPQGAVSQEDLARKMVGSVEPGASATGRPCPDERPLISGEEPPTANREPRTDGVALELHGIAIHDGARTVLRDIALHVHRGEILGIAGVDGNGQGPLIETIVGLRKPDAGIVKIQGQDATQASIRWRRERLAYIPEDRQRQALVLDLPVRDNLLLKEFRDEPYSRPAWLRLARWNARARELVQRFDVRCGSIYEPAAALSGGNQQKVVIARELSGTPKLVVAVNPTRGLDVGATAYVMEQLRAARDAGAAILLVHSDLDELLALSDRVLVMYNGTLTPSLGPRGDKEGIGRLMMGMAEPRTANRGEEPRTGTLGVQPLGCPAETRNAKRETRNDAALREVIGNRKSAIGNPQSLGHSTRNYLLPFLLAATTAACALAAILALLWALGYPAGAVLHDWISGALGSWSDVATSLKTACPLLLTGLAAGVAFRCGVLNIGAEGQFLVGAITSIALTTRWAPPGPAWLVIPLACLAGAAAGAAWGLIASVLERYRGVPLVLSTILLNFVALYVVRMLITGPLQASSGGTQSLEVPEKYGLPILMNGTDLHLGVPLAFALVGVLWLLQSRTRFGFETLVTGKNPAAAEIAGIPIARRALEIMLLSGALAGLGGALQMLGVTHGTNGNAAGYGYTGIAVAMLGRLHPLGMSLAALFFGMLERGAAYAERLVPHNVAQIVEGLVLLIMLAGSVWMLRPRQRRGKVAEVARV